jgi:hypothetical protein
MNEETKDLKMWCVEQALTAAGKQYTGPNEGFPEYHNNTTLIELAIKIYDFLKEDGHTDTN